MSKFTELQIRHAEFGRYLMMDNDIFTLNCGLPLHQDFCCGILTVLCLSLPCVLEGKEPGLLNTVLRYMMDIKLLKVVNDLDRRMEVGVK